jgi:hypothetical protein
MTMAKSVVSTAPWRRYVSPNGLHLPTGIEERLDAGETITFGGRSSSTGRKGRDLAARDAVAGVEQFAEQTGLDFRPLLPPLEVIELRLAEARSETFDGAGGERFSCRFAVLDFIAVAQVVVLVATSSGVKITVDDRQPFVARAAQEYKRNHSAVFSVKELDRSGRQDWGLAPIIMAIQANDGALSDENGCGPIDMGRSMVTFVNGTSAKKMAVGIPKRTRREQKNRTGREMIGGQVACHLSSPPPPGFGTCWLKGAFTNPTERILYLDTDACRPPESSVASGTGSVRHPVGHPLVGRLVDQVENVRYVLAHLGKPGNTKRSIVRDLAARQYSTVMFRGNHSPAASITPNHGADILTSIIDNLRVYEFGVLDRKIGSGLEPLSISGCIPPDGPWATAEDFARIKAHLKESEASAARAVNITFAGLRVTYDGLQAVMLTEAGTQARLQLGGTLRYRFAVAEGYPYRVGAVPVSRRLSASAFAQSIVDGLLEVDGVALEHFDPERFGEPNDSVLNELRVERTNLQARLTGLQQHMDALEARLFELDEDGQPVLHGALFRKSQEDYNLIAEDVQPEVVDRLRQIEHDIADREARLPRSSPADHLLYLVESLRNPEDLSYRGHWLASLKEVSFTSDVATVDGLPVRAIRWEGVLVLQGVEEEVAIPFSGNHQYGRKMMNRRATNSYVGQALEMLREGTSISASGLPRPTLLAGQVASALGISRRHMVLNGCEDPRLLKTSLAVLESPMEADFEIAERLGESEDFVARVRTIHCADDAIRSWVGRPDIARAAFYAVAAANEGRVIVEQVHQLVPATSVGQLYNVAATLRRESSRWSTERKKGYVLAPCVCGSTESALMTIPEPIGAVCLTCHRDEGHLMWPVESYDQYRAHTDLGR